MSDTLRIVVDRSTLRLQIGAVPVTTGGGGAVDSVFGRTGTVVAQSSDYSSYYQPLDLDLTAIAALNTTGWAQRTGANTWTLSTPTASDVGADPAGTAASAVAALSTVYQPLDPDLTAVAGLTTTGLVVRTGAGTATTRAITAPAAGITVSNGDGVSGAPTLALANDLAGIEGLSGTGWARRTGVDTWTLSTPTASDVGAQATDAGLTSLLAVDTAGGLLPYTTAPATWAASTITGFALSLLDDADAATARGTLGVGLNVQVFTSSGTYTKPSGASVVLVILYGAGGGGGGGGSQTGAVVRTGGGGGGGGCRVERVYQASQVGATETVTIGAGGTSGAGGASGAVGAAGGIGGTTTFGSLLSAFGGGGGAAGAISAAANGGGGGGGLAAAGTSGSTSGGTGGGPGAPTTPAGGCGSSGLNTASNPATAEYGGGGGAGGTATPTHGSGGGSLFGGGGGGHGGGATVTPVVANASAGGSTTAGGGGAQGTSGASPTNGTAGTAGNITRGGTGGGGGGGTITANTNGANGGAGGSHGGGGGGGGVGSNTGTGGNGGVGGDGACYVLTWV